MSKKISHYLIRVWVSDLLVEVLPFQDKEVFPWLDYATLCGNGTGCVDVVPGHHSHSDASPLALANRIWHLFSNRVLEEMLFH